MLMKQAGVVAKPISKAKQPARAKPANTAVLSFPPETRGSRPKETLITPFPLLSVAATHSPKLSAIASTAAGVRSTVRPFSPSNATPLTSEPFCNRRIWSMSSSILLVTSLSLVAFEDFVLRGLTEGEAGVNVKKLRLIIPGEDKNRAVLEITVLEAIKDDVEVDAIETEFKFSELEAEIQNKYLKI